MKHKKEIVEGIILAAGFSRRAGVWKMALPIKGRTVIERAIMGMYPVVNRIIVVGGYNFKNLLKIIKKYEKVFPVYNENFPLGMFTSVQKGVEKVSGDRFFILPGDIPLVKPSTYKCMLEQEGDIIVPVYEGRKGHPVLLSYAMKELLLDEERDSNLKAFINRMGFKEVIVDDPFIRMDIDTLEDYWNLTSG
ncbi:nucleotidyltransferase family protein [bacterium]|nr:MAG: nucleotidyltransferase family protein [bacterium]